MNAKRFTPVPGETYDSAFNDYQYLCVSASKRKKTATFICLVNYWEQLDTSIRVYCPRQYPDGTITWDSVIRYGR